MYRIILFFVILQLASTQIVKAKTTITVIEDTSALKLAATNPVLLDEYLLFQTTNEEGVILWSQHIEDNNRVALFEGQIANFQVQNGFRSENKQLLRNNNLVFFLVGDNNDSKKMWRTDGTQTGTFQLESSAIYQGLVSSQGLVFSQRNGGQIIATDGNNVTAHQFTFPSTESICAFGLNDLITRDYDSSNSTTYLKRSKNGIVSDIPVPGGNAFFTVGSGDVLRLGGVCFIGLFRNNTTPEVLMVSESGEVNQLSDSYDTSAVRQIFKLNDRLYARENNQIIRFNENLDGADKSFVFSDELGVYETEVLADYIVAKTTTPYVSPAVNFTHYFDADLNELDELGGTFVPVPEYYLTANGPNYLTSSSNNGIYLLAQDVGMESILLSVKNAFIDEVTSHENQQEIYFLQKDKVTGQRSIVVTAEKPGIGNSVNGLWHDPEVLNQGMSVHTGERADGSKYVFVTVYTFKDGAPFWLAGVAEIQHPQTEIEVLVGDYKDSNMFEAGMVPTEHVFGTLKLEMTACDNLETTLTSDDTSFVLDLSRIDNVQHSHLCIE